MTRLRRTVRQLVHSTSSYGLTCAIVLLLMGVLYLGTYQQRDLGLATVQARYFFSAFWWWRLGPIHVPLPGALTLLSMLALNLLCGGLLRIRWQARTAGIVIVHLGVLALLGSGLVSYLTGTNGYLKLFPGEQAAEYVSFRDFELVIGEPLGDGGMREFCVPESVLRHGTPAHAPGLPFTVRATRFLDSCVPQRARTADAREVVDGFYLAGTRARAGVPAVPGVYLEIVQAGRTVQRGMLWGRQRAPWTAEIDGSAWSFDLRPQVFDLPFTVRLESFTKETHPGVDTPRKFVSEVTRIAGDVRQNFHIAMNEPMRYGGFMLSQNSWGPQGAARGPYWSMLEVSSNPTDQWPKYACFVVAFGLLLHFGRKLFVYLERQRRRRTA